MTQQQLISELPDWVPAEAWEEFVKMRKSIKKPMTDYASKLMLKKLDGLRRAGHDPQAVLDQSILKCWLDIFPVRQEFPQAAAPRQPQFQTPVEKARGWADSITGRARSSNIVDINETPMRRLR